MKRKNQRKTTQEDLRTRKGRTVLSFVKFGLLLFILIGMPLYLFLYHREIFQVFESRESVKAFLEQYRSFSIPVYIAAQAIQIVLCVIPGQAIQLAGGYMYSFWPAYAFSMAGIAAGTVCSFYLSKVLGRDAVHLLFGEEKTGRFVRMLNSKKGYTLVFFLFLFPGIPKDIFTYAAGISEMKLKPFLLLSMLGRSPAMMVSLLMGSLLEKERYTALVFLGIAAVLCFVLGIFFRKKLLNLMSRFYDRMNG